MIGEPGSEHWHPVDVGEALELGPAGSISRVEVPPLVRDEARFAALVRGEFGFVWRSVRRLGVPAGEADDAAQRVFWVAARRLGAIEIGKERAFLFGTATLVALEFRREAARRPKPGDVPAEVADEAPDPEEIADRNRARALLDRVLESMPMEQRTVFVLFELEELSVSDIARLVGVPAGTVASRLRRARELFRTASSRLRSHASHRGGV